MIEATITEKQRYDSQGDKLIGWVDIDGVLCPVLQSGKQFELLAIDGFYFWPDTRCSLLADSKLQLLEMADGQELFPLQEGPDGYDCD